MGQDGWKEESTARGDCRCHQWPWRHPEVNRWTPPPSRPGRYLCAVEKLSLRLQLGALPWTAAAHQHEDQQVAWEEPASPCAKWV